MASQLLYRVICFEDCLRQAGVPSLSTVSVLHPPGAERIAQELRDEIAYYLQHDGERREIAVRARARVLAEHTYEHRVRALLSAIAMA